MATKKIIQLSDELIEIVNNYTTINNLSSFSEAIRLMISQIDKPVEASPSDIDKLEEGINEIGERLELVEKNYKYFQADETLGNINNINVNLNNAEKKLEVMEKKVNILTSVSKMFKGHLENRTIHLQD